MLKGDLLTELMEGWLQKRDETTINGAGDETLWSSRVVCLAATIPPSRINLHVHDRLKNDGTSPWEGMHHTGGAILTVFPALA